MLFPGSSKTTSVLLPCSAVEMAVAPAPHHMVMMLENNEIKAGSPSQPTTPNRFVHGARGSPRQALVYTAGRRMQHCGNYIAASRPFLRRQDHHSCRQDAVCPPASRGMAAGSDFTDSLREVRTCCRQLTIAQAKR